MLFLSMKRLSEQQRWLNFKKCLKGCNVLMTNDLLAKIGRGLRKPPNVIIKRLHHELAGYAERYIAPQRVRGLTLTALLNKTHHQTLHEFWECLSARPYCASIGQINGSVLDAFCPGETNVVLARAEFAIEHRVDLLGSGLIELGKAIDWHRDYKSQHDWPLNYIRDIDYNNPERPSDVKFPWEVSRLQWLIPAGQAYLLTQDERYAQAVKDILLDWITHNPYAYGVNWACTMEVALRIVSWTWFFHVFKASKTWQDEAFQQQFLTCLYLHADFTERHLEYSDINGNHYTADAAGLVFAGLFFGKGDAATRWQRKGWDILCHELPRQVFVDGVDFEASVPYHRLVLELFFLPARYRELLGFDTPLDYRERLCLMAQFSAAYSQPGSTVPLWGDADDARALPFGSQALHDHRYLCGLVGYTWKNKSLLTQTTGSLSEFFWMFGAQATQSMEDQAPKAVQLESCAFPSGGFYIMRNALDHVFIDCGPLGLAGRGGHGHNDCLAFEAVLNGVKLISDCGAYVYTASYSERNLFRSTGYHNTPCIDEQEINRFIRWDYLWTMHDDAKPMVEMWRPGVASDCFRGSHSGYERLTDPVTPKRTIILDHQHHSLTIQDDILCHGSHEVSIPLHLAPDVTASILATDNAIILQVGQHGFTLRWEGASEWAAQIVPARISPSYGVAIPSQKLLWKASIIGNSQLKMCISPNGLS